MRPEATGEPGVSIPELLLKPLPIVVQGLAAGKGKAVQVFGAASFSPGTVKVPGSAKRRTWGAMMRRSMGSIAA